MTHSVATFNLLWWSGNELATSPRYACMSLYTFNYLLCSSHIRLTTLLPTHTCLRPSPWEPWSPVHLHGYFLLSLHRCLNVTLLVRLTLMPLFKITTPRASLVAQWLRICLLMQGTRVRALVWEDPTCHGAAGPVSHNC